MIFLCVLSPTDENILKSHCLDYFFHIASYTDFRSSEIVKTKLWSANVDRTRRVLELAKKVKVNNFIYTGSAYACGETSGNVAPDYINFNQKFRNPYEFYIPAMTSAINMEGMQQVDRQPTDDLNELEAIYYKTVGAIFTPYITSVPIYFTRPDIDEELQCPDVTGENFYKLLQYALDNRMQ